MHCKLSFKNHLLNKLKKGEIAKMWENERKYFCDPCKITFLTQKCSSRRKTENFESIYVQIYFFIILKQFELFMYEYIFHFYLNN